MARYKEAPYGFECPYLHKCPHLGISAVYASAMLSDIERDERRNGHALIGAMKEIGALDEENRTLSARVAELESRLKQQHRMKFKRNSRPAVPQAGGAPDGKPRKRGAPSGHPAWTRRTPDKADRTVRVPPPPVCPHCRCKSIKAVTIPDGVVTIGASAFNGCIGLTEVTISGKRALTRGRRAWTGKRTRRCC